MASSSGVAKVVKLDGKTVLIVPVDPEKTVPEGDYDITSLVVASPGLTDDWCVIQICGAQIADISALPQIDRLPKDIQIDRLPKDITIPQIDKDIDK